PVAPLRRPAVHPGEPRARHRYRDRAKGPDQLALTVAVAMPMRGATTIIAATLQGGVQFRLQHLLDEATNSLANRPFQRIEPILTPEWLRLGGCDSLFHGVISWRLAGRSLGCIPIRRLRRLQIPTTSATRPGKPSSTASHARRPGNARTVRNSLSTPANLICQSSVRVRSHNQ